MHRSKFLKLDKELQTVAANLDDFEMALLAEKLNSWSLQLTASLIPKGSISQQDLVQPKQPCLQVVDPQLN